jgi:D-xylulose reductase
MKALVLESRMNLSLRDFPIQEEMGPTDVKIKIKACGICGSDVHFYRDGAKSMDGTEQPMILGHEASGIIIGKGEKVKNLEVGDLVCMEPGIPRQWSQQVLEGNYNLDPEVVFWATPPVHGCLRETVVHPAQFCYKLPDGLSAAEGAMIEPLAIGIEAAKKAEIKPGDIGLVIGCGTIGVMCAISALAGGCSKVFITDIMQEKLEIAASYDKNIIPINTTKVNLVDFIKKETGGRGCDVLFEASGNPKVYPEFLFCAKRGAVAVLVGMTMEPISVPVFLLQGLGIRLEGIFRYVNCYDRAINLVKSGKINVNRFINRIFSFDEAIKAYEFAAEGHPDVVKVMIELD